MLNLKHTPGPWESLNGNIFAPIEHLNGDIFIPAENYDDEDLEIFSNTLIKNLMAGKGSIYAKKAKVQENANGLLVACAPEMIEVLIETIKSVDNYKKGKDFSLNVEKIIRVIEKATGLPIEEIIK